VPAVQHAGPTSMAGAALFLLRNLHRPLQRGRGPAHNADLHPLPGSPSGPAGHAARSPRPRPAVAEVGLPDRRLRPVVRWPWDLEWHTAAEHPGWTATYELLRPYPNQRMRVVYRQVKNPAGPLTPLPSAAPPAYLKPGVCRRSPPAGDRWHRRQSCRQLGSSQSSREVPAETKDEPAGTGRGTGTQRKDRGSGGPQTSGVVAGTGGSGLAAGGAGQGRGRPPPATHRHLCPGPLRHGRSGPGLVGTRHAYRPALPNQSLRMVYRRVEDPSA
jgi:hypothetical protein